MLKLKKVLPIEKLDPIDLANRSSILEAKLLYTSMSPEEIEEAERELEEINQHLELVPA